MESNKGPAILLRSCFSFPEKFTVRHFEETPPRLLDVVIQFGANRRLPKLKLLVTIHGTRLVGTLGVVLAIGAVHGVLHEASPRLMQVHA